MDTRLSKFFIRDGPTLKSDTPLDTAARQLAGAGKSAAPVFGNGEFAGLFVPSRCWQQLLDPQARHEPVIGFVPGALPTIRHDAPLDNLPGNFQDFIIGLDAKGGYYGYLTPAVLAPLLRRLWGQGGGRFHPFVIESAHVGILAIDRAGIIRILNPAAERILNVSGEKLIGTPIAESLPQSTLAMALEYDCPRVTRLKRLDLKIAAIHSPILQGKKNIGAVSVLNPIVPAGTADAEFEDMKALAGELTAIFENAYDGIYITDGDGKTLRINKAYERITGLNRQELIGRNMKDIVAKGLISESITFKIKKSRKPMTITQNICGGKEILVSGVPVFNEKGALSRVITNVRDMTELNNIGRQLKKSRELAARYEYELKELRANQLSNVEIISNSKKMDEVLELSLRVAKVDSTVLIQGESGVGKEIVANLIHKYSPRSNTGSFIKINCGAIPNDLLESELFGYEEGAFTGAKKQGKPGMFELSNDGTLFLDEIGTLSQALQVKLLRVLQFKEFMRLGGIEPKKVNIRLVTATSQNLEDMVREDKFRKDLFYRLHVVPIHIAPLRERVDDIVPLIVFYLDRYNTQYQSAKRFSKEAIEQLAAYEWPGNVRELKNLVERLTVTTTEDLIGLADLPERVRGSSDITKIVGDFHDNRSLREILDFVEKEKLTQAFAKYRTTRKVGEALKISQSAVMRKVKKHQLRFQKNWEAEPRLDMFDR